MKLVVVETPFAHDKDDIERKNLVWRYLRAALRDCLMRGEAPYASHAIYTQEGVLDDWVPQQRELGILAGFAWGDVAVVRAVYEDLGVSSGMERGIERAKQLGQPIERRLIPGWSER